MGSVSFNSSGADTTKLRASSVLALSNGGLRSSHFTRA
jgi:hypothetical protein